MGFCLPAGPMVSDDDVRYIVDCIKEAMVGWPLNEGSMMSQAWDTSHAARWVDTRILSEEDAHLKTAVELPNGESDWMLLELAINLLIL